MSSVWWPQSTNPVCDELRVITNDKSHITREVVGTKTTKKTTTDQCVVKRLIWWMALWTSCIIEGCTFCPEYILQPCAVLFQKGHKVWNSGSTFLQFWVKREIKQRVFHFAACWVTTLICSVSLHPSLPQNISMGFIQLVPNVWTKDEYYAQ